MNIPTCPLSPLNNMLNLLLRGAVIVFHDVLVAVVVDFVVLEVLGVVRVARR